MSLQSNFKVGDLVFVKKNESSTLGPLNPIKKDAVGIILKIKKTKIFPQERKTELYKIFISGEIQELLSESINNISLDT